MSSNEHESISSGPCFCPGCGWSEREGVEGALCQECGDTLVPQGFCPVCEDHWSLEEGGLCPKHDVVLEAHVPASSAQVSLEGSISWTTVEVFPTTLAAFVARSRLEAEGIPTFLDGERIGSAGLHAAAPLGVRLQVPADQAAEARVILSQNWSLPADEKADFEELL